MKLEIQQQQPLTKSSPTAITIPDSDNFAFTSIRKCSKKKQLSKHKTTTTSSTIASDSQYQTISTMQDVKESFLSSSSKKARRNLNFDELHLQCPELEEEGENDECGQQSNQQEQSCDCDEDKRDIDTVKINKQAEQNGTMIGRIEEFNMFDQMNYSNFNHDNNPFDNSSKLSAQKINLSSSMQAVEASSNFMACFSQIEEHKDTQVDQDNYDNMDQNSSEQSDQMIPNNENNHNNFNDENQPAKRMGLPSFSKRQAFGDITKVYQLMHGTQEIPIERQTVRVSNQQESEEIEEKEVNELQSGESDQDMEQVERLLFNPVDDVNFIEEDNSPFDNASSRQDEKFYFQNQENSLPFQSHFFTYGQQENNSANHHVPALSQNENNNSNAQQQLQQQGPNFSSSFHVPSETNSLPFQSVLPQQELTMKEQLATFEEDEAFGFDEEDKDALEQNEEFFMISADNLLNYRSTFTNFPQKRAVLLDWMQEVSSSLSFKRETYQQSVSIMDRFFQQVPLIPKIKIQLVAATALILAHKMEEVHIWKIEDFIMACNYGYTREQFLEMEQQIWQTLEYRLSSTPGYFWMNQLMLEWDVFSEQFEQLFENDVIQFKKNTQESFRMFSSVCQYLDCVLYSIQSYNYNWNTLVVSFMYWALYQSIDIANHPVRLSYLDQIFEKFVSNTLHIPSFQHMNLQLTFTAHFLNLNINPTIPICKKEQEAHSTSNSNNTVHYQSYENVCSQQIYNQDCLRLFNST